MLKTTGMVVLPRRGRLQLTPIYAAFQMAKAMARGEIVETTSTGELEAMACRDDRVPSVVAAVNNHTSDAARASVDVRDLPFLSSRAWVGVQRIDAQHSVLGRGLDPPSWHKRSVTRRRLTLSLQLAPHATAQISIYPAKGN